MATQYVTFTLDGAHYGVDVAKVQEVLRAQRRTPVPLADADVAGLVNLRGQVVMTVDLRTRLGLPALPAGQEPMMVVAQVAGETVSLLVDEIGDVVEVDTDQFERPPETLVGPMRDLITGAYKLESGLLLALDVERATA
ncbi:chemotaxis protein CheW [mine drainage metagenome]|uniref:Chemotaxis protein CheW n=1 Tax=mine drainage metagenome TaxID=410659 RepID=A0A1J5PAP0_9ZZZZ